MDRIYTIQQDENYDCYHLTPILICLVNPSQVRTVLMSLALI